MKLNEVKNGLWLRNRSDHANHARVIYVSEKPSALTYIWNRSDKPYSCRFDEMYRYFDAISTPAELSAAGVKEEDRLAEQRDVWDGVKAWVLRSLPKDKMVWLSIDNHDRLVMVTLPESVYEKDCGKVVHNVVIELSDERYNELRSRADIAQAVADFRSRRAGGEGKKLACGLEVRVGDLITRGDNPVRIYKVSKHKAAPDCECSLDGFDQDAWYQCYATNHLRDWRIATPAEIAATTIKLDDIANPELRAEVEKIRNPKRLACGHVLKAGDVTTALGTFRFWQVEPKERIARWIWEKEQERFGRACVQDADPSERLITPADAPELLKQNFPIEKLPADVRQAVEALRRPTLPDGSEVKVNEMYVSNRGWLQRVLVRSVSVGDTWQRDYFDPNCRRWASGLPVDDRGECPTPANNLARLAQPADIPNEVSIDIVPSRIREQVRQQRGAGALKWNGWYVFRQLGNEQQRWEFGQWVPVPDPHKTIDEMATASPSQIIAANVPEQDIPACQIEGVRAERAKQAESSSPSSPPPESGTPFDETTWPIGAWLKHNSKDANRFHPARINGYGVTVNVAENEETTLEWSRLAECFIFTIDGKSWHRCIVESLNGATPQQIIAASSPSPERDAPTWPDGTPISKAEYIYALESTGVPASEIEIRQSPSPDSGACKCEAANTLRDLIEAFDGWNDAKTHASLTEGYQSLRRKFELARESLGAGTEAAA